MQPRPAPMTYRQSHLGKAGAAYDAALAGDGLDAFMSGREDALLRELAPRLGAAGGGRYLDFACGSGRILVSVAPAFRDVVAVDVSENMVAEARRKVPGAAFHVVDLTVDPLDLGRFDLITAFRFFGNAEDGLRRAVLRRLRGLIADDGCLLINNHRNPASLLATLSRHAEGMDLTYPKLEALLAEHGFAVSRRIPIGAWMLRHRWSERAVWDSWAGRLAERLARPAALCRYAPDMLVLARPV